MELDEFRLLTPEEMKEHLLNSPITAVLVKRIRERPIKSEADIAYHVELYKAELEKEAPGRQFPPENVIRLSIMLALEKMAIDDGVAMPYKNTVRH